ncbi:unnamed protein product, partial [Closterium sp. NIES-53]
MTTLRVLLHVAAQRDYELHSLDFSIAFLQGSLHEEIWLRRPPGFTGSFPPGTQWSLRRPVYGLRQEPREWHDTLRTTLAALGFAPSTADPSLFLHTDTSLPPFYVLFVTTFLQGSLHEEIWLRRPLGFTGSFPPGTQWSLRRPVYGLRQAPREWHDTLRTTLAALGFAPSTADPSLFLHTDTSLPPFYVLFVTTFLQGSLHEEIWLRRPLGFTGSFPPGTQWSLRRPVYGLRQAPREWHDTLRTTFAALGFAPSTADASLFLRTDTSLPPFYVLVYVDDLVFAIADTAGLAHVKSELQKRHTCTDL